jgi:hypothetical protein
MIDRAQLASLSLQFRNGTQRAHEQEDALHKTQGGIFKARGEKGKERENTIMNSGVQKKSISVRIFGTRTQREYKSAYVS